MLGYRALVEVEKRDTLGDATTLHYQATSSPPAPASGDDRSSDHPTMTWPTGRSS